MRTGGREGRGHDGDCHAQRAVLVPRYRQWLGHRSVMCIERGAETFPQVLLSFLKPNPSSLLCQTTPKPNLRCPGLTSPRCCPANCRPAYSQSYSKRIKHPSLRVQVSPLPGTAQRSAAQPLLTPLFSSCEAHYSMSRSHLSQVLASILQLSPVLSASNTLRSESGSHLSQVLPSVLQPNLRHILPLIKASSKHRHHERVDDDSSL